MPILQLENMDDCRTAIKNLLYKLQGELSSSCFPIKQLQTFRLIQCQFLSSLDLKLHMIMADKSTMPLGSYHVRWGIKDVAIHTVNYFNNDPIINGLDVGSQTYLLTRIRKILEPNDRERHLTSLAQEAEQLNRIFDYIMWGPRLGTKHFNPVKKLLLEWQLISLPGHANEHQPLL